MRINNSINTVLIIVVSFIAIALFIPTPALAGSYFPDGRPNPAANQYFLIDNNEYSLPGTGAYSFKIQDEDIGKTWEFDFYLTQAQTDQLHLLENNNPDITTYELFEQIVPDQVAALPSDLQTWLNQHLWNPKPMPGEPKAGYTYDPTTQIGVDPSGTAVPKEYVPNEELQFLDPDYNGPAILGGTLMQYGNITGYTPDASEHLANLGLSTDYTKTDLNATSSMSGGHYTITLTGNTPEGGAKTWTFVLDENKLWHDAATGQAMSIDAQYILSAMYYVDPPEENTVTQQVSKSLSTQVSTMPQGTVSTANLSSLVSKSSQYTQSNQNQSINTNILVPKIVVFSSSPIVKNTGNLPLKTESLNIDATNLPPVTLPSYPSEKTAKISLPLSGTAFSKNIAFV